VGDIWHSSWYFTNLKLKLCFSAKIWFRWIL